MEAFTVELVELAREHRWPYPLKSMRILPRLKTQSPRPQAVHALAQVGRRRNRRVAFHAGRPQHPGSSLSRKAECSRLHGPIGIDINGRVPAEIAIPILAEISAPKDGVVLPASVKMATPEEQVEFPAGNQKARRLGKPGHARQSKVPRQPATRHSFATKHSPTGQRH